MENERIRRGARAFFFISAFSNTNPEPETYFYNFRNIYSRIPLG